MSISFSTGTREWQASAPQERNLPKRPWGISASHLKLQSLKGCFRLGFIRAVWIDIAQGISGAHGIMQCDGCKGFDVCTKWRPKTGQANYGDACGDKAAKLLKRCVA